MSVIDIKDILIRILSNDIWDHKNKKENYTYKENEMNCTVRQRSFFQTAVVSILLCGCTTWTLTKKMEKKLEGNYKRMLREILNKSWRQHSTKHQLYGHLPPITKTIKDEPETLLEKQGRAHKWCSPMEPLIWLSKSRATNSNLHTAAVWGYGM